MVSFQSEFCLHYGPLPVIPYKQRPFTFHNHNFDFHRAKSWKINIWFLSSNNNDNNYNSCNYNNQIKAFTIFSFFRFLYRGHNGESLFYFKLKKINNLANNS